MYAVLLGEDEHLHWTEVPDPQIKGADITRGQFLKRTDLNKCAGIADCRRAYETS